MPLSSPLLSLQPSHAVPSRTTQPATWLEIDRTAFEHNITLYKQIIGSSVALAIVVKSNAYGHGLLTIARWCQELTTIDWLCTTSLSEAIALRNVQVTKPILVLSILDLALENVTQNDIDIVVYDMATIYALSAIAQQYKKTVFVHIKIDTGLSRFGFLPEQAIDIVTHIRSLPFIAIRGICSHFAHADGPDTSSMQQQEECFRGVLDQLDLHNLAAPIVHVSGSAGTLRAARNHGSLVRIGAGAYGLPPSVATMADAHAQHPDCNLRQVMTWKTTIMHIRTVAAGCSIGYGRSYFAQQEMIIGVLPVGYYEGYDRRLSNKGTVLVITRTGMQGYAPIVGRVCMNVVMIDLSSLPTARQGDEVILLGNYPGITAHDIAQTIESFNPREFLVRINPLLPRIMTPGNN